MVKSVSLVVGEVFHLGHGKDSIVYAGMPSEGVFSAVQIKAVGKRGYSWNLFFPKRQRDIDIDGVTIRLESVTPEVITFCLR